MSQSDDAFEKLAAGETSEAIFEAAVPVLAGAIRGYLAWFGVRGESLEDLAQEAMVRVYINRVRRRGSNVPSMRRWIQTVCRNLVVDSARGTNTDPAADWPEAETPDHSELCASMKGCLAVLKEPDATVFRLRYELGWSTREIASLFGWRPRNCELILARARKRMAACLRQRGFE
jgi:RNA polymerase sigma factor (sigma-70 family)